MGGEGIMMTKSKMRNLTKSFGGVQRSSAYGFQQEDLNKGQLNNRHLIDRLLNNRHLNNGHLNN